MTRLAEVLDQLDQLSGAVRPASLVGKAHQLLADLHAHLSGAAWGKMVKEATADGVPPAAEPAETSSRESDAAAAGTTPLQAKNRPDALAPGTVRAMQPPVPAGIEPKAEPAEPRPASASGTSTAAAAPAKVEGEPPAAPHASSGFSAAAGSGDGRRGVKAAETPRPEMPVADTISTAAGAREELNADLSGGRSSTGDRSLSKDLGGADAAADSATQAADAPDTAAPDPRLARLPETGSERAAEAVAAGKEKEPAAGAHRTGLFDQIVQRAVVQVRNDQSEVKIDLKPDFLGNVRMQILTENQQVSVRITTEFPAVRDMIEAGLQQLKSELQNQGLHVDRLEVSVSDDPHKQPRRQAKHDANSRPGAAEGVLSADRRAAENRLEPVYYRARPGGAATIDMFA
jgi:flagellar hook-length control protein FliK